MVASPSTNVSMMQNLKDAGCSMEMAKCFFQYQEEGKTESQLRLLSEQRRLLLDKVHENQKKLDCLDYLIFYMKKKV